MPARDRLPPWHERHRLANGRDVLVRPVRPEDAEPLRAGFGLLQPRALRDHWTRLTGELSAEAAQRLARPNPRTEFMLVASDPEPPGEAVIAALAHVQTDADTRQGEFVVLVSPFIAQLGMGRYLLTRIAKWARSRPVRYLAGDVPAAHAPMLELARTLGFERTDGAFDPAYVRIAWRPAPA